MKKFKYVLMSLSLVLCFLFLTACGNPTTTNQLDVKPTLNTTGDYSTTLTKDEFDNALTQDDGSGNKVSIIKYDDNISGIKYYMKTEAEDFSMEMNAILKFSLTDQTSPMQCAMKMSMKFPAGFGFGEDPIVMYAYVKDFDENKIYVQSEYAGLKIREYYALDGADEDITSGIEDAVSFNPEELYEMVNNYIAELTNNITFTKTEKDSNGLVKYKIAFNPNSNDDTIEDITTPVPTGNMDIYLIVKEIENEVYFQGYSVDVNLTMGEGSDAITQKTSMIITLCSDNIEFPDFSDYVEGTPAQ